VWHFDATSAALVAAAAATGYAAVLWHERGIFHSRDTGAAWTQLHP